MHKNNPYFKINYFKCIPNDSNVVGRCKNLTHIGNMSAAMIKQHKCIEKNCPYLEKDLHSMYWTRKLVVNALRKFHKNGNRGHIVVDNVKIRNLNRDITPIVYDVHRILESCEFNSDVLFEKE